MTGKTITLTLTWDQAFDVAGALYEDARGDQRAAAVLDEMIAEKNGMSTEFASIPEELRVAAMRKEELAEQIKRLAYNAGDRRYSIVGRTDWNNPEAKV